MTYSVLNNYNYADKSYFLTACDWLSHPLRAALGGRTIQLASGREQQGDRIGAIALCCFVIPIIIGAIGLLLKYISHQAKLMDRMHHQNNTPPPSTSLLSLSDEVFVYVYFSNMPALTFEQARPPISAVFIKSFTDHLFEEFLGEQSSETIDIVVGLDGELYIQQGPIRNPLKEVIECINWGNLEKHWKALGEEKTHCYIQKSLLFEQLRDMPATMESPFNYPSPFIHLYTSNGFYAIVNALLRRGKLQSGKLIYASQDTNKKLAENDRFTICKIVKEVLFVSLMMTGTLCDLPDRYLAQEKVIRIAHIPRIVLDRMHEGQIIADRGFLSASAIGGGFAGGGPCDESSFRVRYSITSKNGKHVSAFSEVQENEVLFRPFSPFKISKRTGDERSGFKIEMEEI